MGLRTVEEDIPMSSLPTMDKHPYSIICFPMCLHSQTPNKNILMGCNC